MFRFGQDTLELEYGNTVLTTLHAPKFRLNGNILCTSAVNNRADILDILFLLEQGPIHHDGVEGALKGKVDIARLEAVIEVN
jgi:hypothetical protein